MTIVVGCDVGELENGDVDTTKDGDGRSPLPLPATQGKRGVWHWSVKCGSVTVVWCLFPRCLYSRWLTTTPSRGNEDVSAWLGGASTGGRSFGARIWRANEGAKSRRRDGVTPERQGCVVSLHISPPAMES